MDTGSREENASKKQSGASALIGSEPSAEHRLDLVARRSFESSTALEIYSGDAPPAIISATLVSAGVNEKIWAIILQGVREGNVGGPYVALQPDGAEADGGGTDQLSNISLLRQKYENQSRICRKRLATVLCACVTLP